MLIAVYASERASQFGDEDGDGIVFWVQGAGCRVQGVKVGIKVLGVG